ncbi:MAG: HAMP domain-containing histidine kinase [Elusimicrobia bacterium]|nr:HAMP domain-containing histidine kinase [Elusimicrobiota bacterium]
MSIRAQMAGIIGGLLFIVIGVTAVGLYWAERSALLQKMEETRETQLSQFAQSLRDALMVHDDLAAMNTANAFLKSPGVIDAYAVGAQDLILAHAQPARVGKKEIKVDAVRRTQDIPLGNKKAIAVTVYDPAHLIKEVDRSLKPVARRIAGVSLAALGIGWVAAWLLASRMIRPIQRIAEGTRRIASGDLSHRLALGRGNELKRLAADFDKMAERLGEVDQMKKDFVSNVTHELRSPLSAIESYLNLVTDAVREGDLSHTLDHLAILRNNATRLGRFIDDVLDLSKIEARGVDLRMEPLDPATLLNDVSTLFHAKAQEKSILLTVAATPKATLWADADKMQQILINLVGNALKFTPSGGKIILSATGEGHRVRLDVTDTGPGIPANDVDRIFDRFEQAKNRAVPPGAPKGTGLGLAIARGLVEAQGGTITVKSVLGKGTTFSVFLKEPTACNPASS